MPAWGYFVVGGFLLLILVIVLQIGGAFSECWKRVSLWPASIASSFFTSSHQKNEESSRIEAQTAAEKSKSEREAKAAEPFMMAAREVIEEGNKIESAVRMGTSYAKYSDLLVAFAAKVEGASREYGYSRDLIRSTPADSIFKYLSESSDHYKKALHSWSRKIQRNDTPKNDKILHLELDAGGKSIEIAAYFLHLARDENEHSSIPAAGIANLKKELDSLNDCLETLGKYGFSEREETNINIYLDDVELQAKMFGNMISHLGIDEEHDPISRIYDRRLQGLEAPLDALKEQLKTDEEDAAKKRKKADADLESAMALARLNPDKPEILSNAEESHKRIMAETEESIDIIQGRIKAEKMRIGE